MRVAVEGNNRRKMTEANYLLLFKSAYARGGENAIIRDQFRTLREETIATNAAEKAIAMRMTVESCI